MTLDEAVTEYRTLVVEGRDGIVRSGLLAELAGLGFLVRGLSGNLHHLDPTRPYRELLAAPGQLAVDGSIIRELVYGPLRRGRSRVTWIQALDFAEAVAERDGAMIHVVEPPSYVESRLLVRDALGPAEEEALDAITAYERAFRTLAQHVPVVTVETPEPGHPIRGPAVPCGSQLWQKPWQLTVG